MSLITIEFNFAVSVSEDSKISETLVTGKISHHSIELFWGSGENLRSGPNESWTRYAVEKMDPKTHTYDTIYV